MNNNELKKMEYPLCPKCKNKTLGVYARGKLEINTKLVFERLGEFCFCPKCDKMFKIELKYREINHNENNTRR